MTQHQHKARSAKRHSPQVPAHVLSFVRVNAVHAQLVASRYRIPASIVLAQSGLESGWGLHVKGNAYFGVKGRAPDGNSVDFVTHENVAAGRVETSDSFRAYASYADAADDYGRMLSTNPRFVGAFAHSDDPSAFADALQLGGYATDPSYATKLKQVIKSFQLGQYDAH